jgi:hypothetical protein
MLILSSLSGDHRFRVFRKGAKGNCPSLLELCDGRIKKNIKSGSFLVSLSSNIIG